MKNRILIAIIALAFVGCSKEELPTATSGNTDGVTGVAKVAYRVFDGMQCSSSGGTCLPDVIVVGRDQRTIDDVFGVIGNGDQSAIKTAFVNNRTVLEKYIPKQTVADVIAKKLDVSTTDGDSGGSLHYMVFDTPGKTGTWIVVVPFKD